VPSRHVSPGLDELAEARDVARAVGQVDERIELEQLVLDRLRPAAAQTITLEGSRSLAARASIRRAWKRSSAFSRMVQVLNTSTSASSGAVASPRPSDSSSPFMRSESWTFIWQPNVVTL
jgi:hypothetical protein